MAFRLIPREEKFYTDFQALADELLRGAELLEAMLAPDHPLWEKANEIKEVEHKCDVLTHEIIQRLNRTFVTPLDREDIHRLATRLDNVVDLMDGTARRAQMFHLSDRREHAKELTQILVKATESIAQAASSLKDSHKVARIGREVKLLEEAADAIYSKAVGALFEGTPNALDVIKWKELYDNIEDAIDECEDVLNVLESVSLKNS